MVFAIPVMEHRLEQEIAHYLYKISYIKNTLDKQQTMALNDTIIGQWIPDSIPVTITAQLNKQGLKIMLFNGTR